jgi:hypothetical protein
MVRASLGEYRSVDGYMGSRASIFTEKILL